jgi:UDP-N-acetylmuramyl pentapeptide phosphotransferase/UDP-N-acetylglucosamine-1-phosphate transferase
LTVLWIVGVTNSINLLDGIDGLVSGVTFLIAVSLAIINALHGNVLLALLTVCLAGACIGFLPHNHFPARIFLGDSGSLTIGIVLACVGVISLFRSGTTSAAANPVISVPLILFGLPLFDTARVMVVRLLRGVSIGDLMQAGGLALDLVSATILPEADVQAAEAFSAGEAGTTGPSSPSAAPTVSPPPGGPA